MPKTTALRMLDETILPFWQAMRDDENGGFYGCMDYDLQLDKNAPKGGIHTSRILWFFATAAKQMDRPDLLEYARHAYTFLCNHLWDNEHGGIYWMVDAKGGALDTTKHTYCQAFAVYGLAAYYTASGDTGALEKARQLYSLIEQRCRVNNGYGEAFSRAFAAESNEKLSENGVLAQRTMNTLLHVFEAYAGLYDATGDKAVADSMRFILDIYTGKVYNPARHRQEVFFDEDWNSLLDLTSYGHDIESSWLMDWGTALLGDEALAARVADINSELAQAVYKAAYHKNSVWNECEAGVEDTHRVWWVQAEAAVGFLHQWQKHPGQTHFYTAVENILAYISSTMVDKRPGSEWFWRVDDAGRPDTQKPMVEPWKCPYHNGRMCLEILRRL